MTSSVPSDFSFTKRCVKQNEEGSEKRHWHLFLSWNRSRDIKFVPVADFILTGVVDLSNKLLTCLLSSICFRLLSASFSESTGFFFAASSPLASLILRKEQKVLQNQNISDFLQACKSLPSRGFETSLYPDSSRSYPFFCICRIYRWSFFLVVFVGTHISRFLTKFLTHKIVHNMFNFTDVSIYALLPW